MKAFSVCGAVLGTLFALVTVSPCQVNPPAKDTKETKVFNARANLLVVDDKDHFVSGIKADDIKLFEKGVEQKITYFSAKAPRLNVSLVIDNSGSVGYELDEIIKISKLVVANLSPSDKANVIRFVSRDKIEVLQE